MTKIVIVENMRKPDKEIKIFLNVNGISKSLMITRSLFSELNTERKKIKSKAVAGIPKITREDNNPENSCSGIKTLFSKNSFLKNCSIINEIKNRSGSIIVARLMYKIFLE